MSKELLEIQIFLKRKSSKRGRDSWLRYNPSAEKGYDTEKVYGVYLSEVNKLVPKYKDGGFPLVKELWKSGYQEERILAGKILGKICKRYPDLTLKIAKLLAKDIRDWGSCDTLATQGIRGITKMKQKEIFKISRKLVKSRNFWERRFGIVLLVNFAKDKGFKGEIKRIIRPVENDKEHYVKKAVQWIKRDLSNL